MHEIIAMKDITINDDFGENRFYLRSSQRPAYPGFIVTTMDTVGTSVISSPMNMNVDFLL